MKVLGAVVQQPISIVCALAEKNIKTPEDLIGKTIGYSGTRFGEVAVGQMLETVGATLDDVELIDVGFDLMSAMTTGNVDATFGCFINHEVPALEEEGFAVDYMEVMDYGVPNYYALMLVTGEDQLEANGTSTLGSCGPVRRALPICRRTRRRRWGSVGQPGRGELPLDGVRGTAKL